MKTLSEKYQELFEKSSSPKSCDWTRAAIYSFKKHCKHCRAGLKKVKPFDPREVRRLYRAGYCSEECRMHGPRQQTFVRSMKLPIRSKPKNMVIDDMVAVSKALEEQESRLPPFIRTLKEVDKKYFLLSEKLSAMEHITGEKWYQSKYYYWLRRTC